MWMLRTGLVFVGAVALAIVGPRRFWERQVHRAERACRCACGQVFAGAVDLPRPLRGERWQASEWFGSHVTICVPGASAAGVARRVRQVQREADEAFWRREGARQP